MQERKNKSRAVINKGGIVQFEAAVEITTDSFAF